MVFLITSASISPTSLFEVNGISIEKEMPFCIVYYRKYAWKVYLDF